MALQFPTITTINEDYNYSDSPDSSSVQLTENERKCLELQSPEELKKSKYDLPIEFHPKAYDLWHKNEMSAKSRISPFWRDSHKNFEKYIISQKTSIMYLCESQKPNRTSVFEFLNDEVLSSALKGRPSFYAYRLMAIHMLRSYTLLKMQIIAENELCPSLNEIPHKLFSWSADNYVERRQIDNTVWLEVFERDFKDSLEIMKFKFDMKELCQYLDMILCGALIEDKGFSFENGVITPLEDASDLLSVYSRLKRELEDNSHIIRDLRLRYQHCEQVAALQEEEGRTEIMTQLAEVDITFPIKYRYQKAWYEAQVDQVDIKQESEITMLNNAISNWNSKIADENVAVQNFLSVYYSQLEYYKRKFNEFSEKFENEFEDLDNAISYKKMSMSKLEMQRKSFEDQIQQMREKVEDFHAKKLFEKQEAMRLKKEQAESEMLKTLQAEKEKKKKEKKKKYIKKI